MGSFGMNDYFRALLQSLKLRDAQTYAHSRRVAKFSTRLAREFGLSIEETLALEIGAMMHDIGKIGIPDTILRKPAALTNKEWQTMRRHPELGWDLLHKRDVQPNVASIVLQHHEHWDGSGYPHGLRGNEIDLNARILAVADAFDAMCSNRVYRLSKSYSSAAAELNRFAGKQFDPGVVTAFHRVPVCEWTNQLR